MFNNDQNDDTTDLVGEFTLEDTYDHLNQIHRELSQQMEDLINITANNDVQTLSTATTPENIRDKQQILVQNLLDNVCLYGYDTSDKPIPHTEDVFKLASWEFQQELTNLAKMHDRLQQNISITKNNISYLENEKNGLQRMKETYINGLDNMANIVQNDDILDTKRLFSSVKRDLALVVETIFPEHADFREILAELTSSYANKGDEVYVDVDKRFNDCVKFLVEAGIATYHPNDKNQVRLMDLI